MEEEETVQVEEEETVEEMARDKRPSKEKEEKCQEQLPTKALFIMNGTLNGHLLL